MEIFQQELEDVQKTQCLASGKKIDDRNNNKNGDDDMLASPEIVELQDHEAQCIGRSSSFHPWLSSNSELIRQRRAKAQQIGHELRRLSIITTTTTHQQQQEEESNSNSNSSDEDGIEFDERDGIDVLKSKQQHRHNHQHQNDNRDAVCKVFYNKVVANDDDNQSTFTAVTDTDATSLLLERSNGSILSSSSTLMSTQPSSTEAFSMSSIMSSSSSSATQISTWSNSRRNLFASETETKPNSSFSTLSINTKSTSRREMFGSIDERRKGRNAQDVSNDLWSSFNEFHKLIQWPIEI